MALTDDRHAFKLGLFGTNCSGGIIMSAAGTGFDLDWAGTTAIARQADAMDLDLLVPIARWRGYGGATNPNGESYETFTWAAGLAAQTERITIVATAHAPAVHPLVAAKAATTADHISQGRLALNVVMGWFPDELAMFGIEPADHDARYAYGDEWLTIIRRLWTEDEPFDHHGRFLECRQAQAFPKPVADPQIINAGSSPAGIDFSARQADFNFLSIFTLDTAREHAAQIKTLAREQYGREIRVLTYGTVWCADTEEEAQAQYAAVRDSGDHEAAENFMAGLGLNSESFGDQMAFVRERFVTSGGGYPIVGTPEQVAQELIAISEAGLDGMVFGFLDHTDGLTRLERDVIPLLRDDGLRG